MPKTMRRWTALTLIIAAALACGCADDDCPTCPQAPDEAFEILLTCVDEDGAPLPNVVVGAMPALPASVFPWGPDEAAVKSSTTLRVELAEALRIRVAIRDVEGGPVSILDEGVFGSGVHHFQWIGRYGDTGVHTPPGYYEAVLSIDEGPDLGWTPVDSLGLLQAAFDPSQFDLGATDAAGRLRITDRRLVPAFFDLPPLLHVDESGDLQGTFTLTRETWLFCQRSDRAQYARGVIEAVDGPQELTVVFGAGPPSDRADPAVAAPRPLARGKDARASFGLPVPNPFN